MFLFEGEASLVLVSRFCALMLTIMIPSSSRGDTWTSWLDSGESLLIASSTGDMETVKECSLKPKIYTFILLKMFGVKSHKGYRISTIKIGLAKNGFGCASCWSYLNCTSPILNKHYWFWTQLQQAEGRSSGGDEFTKSIIPILFNLLLTLTLRGPRPTYNCTL